MALEKLKRKATELWYGPRTYWPDRKIPAELRGKAKKKVLTKRTKTVKKQLKRSGLTDKELARFMK